MARKLVKLNTEKWPSNHPFVDSSTGWQIGHGQIKRVPKKAGTATLKAIKDEVLIDAATGKKAEAPPEPAVTEAPASGADSQDGDEKLTGGDDLRACYEQLLNSGADGILTGDKVKLDVFKAALTEAGVNTDKVTGAIRDEIHFEVIDNVKD